MTNKWIRLDGWDAQRVAKLFRQLMSAVTNWDGTVWWELHKLETPPPSFGVYGCRHELPVDEIVKLGCCSIHEATTLDWNSGFHRAHELPVYDWDGKGSGNYTVFFGEVGGDDNPKGWLLNKPPGTINESPSITMIYQDEGSISSRNYTLSKSDVIKLGSWFKERNYETINAYLEGDVECMSSFTPFAAPFSGPGKTIPGYWIQKDAYFHPYARIALEEAFEKLEMANVKRGEQFGFGALNLGIRTTRGDSRPNRFNRVTVYYNGKRFTLAISLDQYSDEDLPTRVQSEPFRKILGGEGLRWSK